ncbi:acyltransferase family protein [Actinokineospora globicatena]|uniref:Acyltransferase n=1 Tax=Actinokineospora globicatena TaxID=103729 RepID=A0A9W6VAI7_9PSEU|nr:acyltransferase [Actinokineospora globicatena]MCP2301155.1 Peptidoglycan/LPS O-acetylase OafA/YrhL, contains acyltransferase and SGNH-hydrolase domains [Actinokineospora globicatena]GLW77209.1 acyltransferase [Actinokineospora globicatena]GLW84043.1 acyltransferase [Actinokineospora globicatena]GLW92013.1 acyltransferase [Actinokineospora globicatena]
MLDHDDYRGARYFPALDGLRAVAVVLVAFALYASSRFNWLDEWVGVSVFFVLTGFLVTRLLLRPEPLKEFYARRFFRLVPLYLAILLGVAAFAYLRGEFQIREMPRLLMYYLTFNNEFAGADPLFGTSWIVGIEAKFYLVWPLAVVALGRFAPLALVPAVALVPFSGMAVSYVLLLLGSVVAFVLHYPRTFALVRPLTHPWAVVPVGLLCIGLSRWHLGVGIGASLLVICLVSSGPVHHVFSAFRFVGRRAYAMYLLLLPTHFVVVLVAPPLKQDSLVTVATVLVVSLCLADLVHRWVEKPVTAFGKRLLAKRQAPPTADHEPTQPSMAAAA